MSADAGGQAADRPGRRILVLQSGRPEHFLSAARAVRARYPDACLIGLIRDDDHEQIVVSGLFVSLHPLPIDLRRTRALPIWSIPFDACVVPFEYRLGVQYWTFRLVPLRHRIPVVFAFNRLGRLTRWRWSGWLFNTIFVSFAIRPFHHVIIQCWLWLRERADVTGIFALAMLALPYQLFRVLRIHPQLRRTASDSRAPRRLVLFIPSLGVGGAQRQLVSFLEHLDRNKWDPQIVTLDMPDKFFEPMARAHNVPIHYLNPQGDFCMSGIVRRLADYLRRHPCAVLHSWLHYAAALGAIAGSLAGVETVVGSLRSERPGRFPWFYPRWRRALDIVTTPLQTRIIANSSAVREDNRQWAFIPRRKLITVYNGIDCERPEIPHRDRLSPLRRELGLPESAPVVGIVGRLFPEKDHATFLQAARLIADRRTDTQFLVIGEGVLRETVQMDIKRLGLDGQVHVLGNRKDVLALIRLMDVCVLTSVSEGFPNVLLEAGALGTAIVTTAAGGAVEIILDGETGYVVPVADAQGIAARTLALLNDPCLRRRFGEMMLERTRALFSAERMTRAIEHVYEECRGGPAPLRVCFLSPYVYGRLNPASGRPVGGAELQIAAVADALTCNPSLQVSVLTTDGDRRTTERRGTMTMHLVPLWGSPHATVKPLPIPSAPMPIAQCPLPIHVVRRVVGALPAPLARAVRLPGRLFYSLWRGLSLRYWRGRRWLADRRYEVRIAFRWVHELAKVRADVYVMRCASPQLGYAALATRLLRRKLVYMVAHHIDVSGAYARSQGAWGRRYEQGLRRADMIVCQHDDQARLLRETYGREGVVIRSTSLSPVGSGAVLDRCHILWIARLDEWKRPELFLDLAARMPDQQFVMVGMPSETDPIDESGLMARIGALPNLRWNSRIPFAETTALFDAALMFVNTSRAEGFPNTFLQAAARGTPIVSWTVNPDDVLERHEFGFCARGDWPYFEATVRRLCTDRALAEKLGENGRRYVSRYHDPSHIAAQYAGLIQSLVDRKAKVKVQAKAEAEVKIPDSTLTST